QKQITTLQLKADAAVVGTQRATNTLLRVLGNPEGVGGSVTVTASLGTLSGGAPASGAGTTVQLVGNGVDPAEAILAFTGDPTHQGVSQLIASGGNATASTTLTVAGPPVFSPGAVAVTAGSGAKAVVQSAAGLADCQATPVQNLLLTANGVDLSGGPVSL